MARKAEPARRSTPKLLVSSSEATTKVEELINRGRPLLEKQINEKEDLEQAEIAHRKWAEYSKLALRKIFDSDEEEEKFRNSSLRGFALGEYDFWREVKYLQEDIKGELAVLEGILERIELYDVSSTVSVPAVSSKSRTDLTNEIFVVHGHDAAAHQAVARLIQKVGLIPVILHERPNQGKTIIEKFEHNATAGFAIVLLTGDDIGGVKTSEMNQLKPRARQNVVFELGYFIGKFGRDRTVVLYEEGVELPSDMNGIVWVALDKGDAWHFRVAKELKAAGFDINMNLV